MSVTVVALAVAFRSGASASTIWSLSSATTPAPCSVTAKNAIRHVSNFIADVMRKRNSCGDWVEPNSLSQIVRTRQSSRHGLRCLRVYHDAT